MYGQKFGRKLVKAAQNREKQEWATEKPKLDNARRLRGIYFIGPDDEEYTKILKNARRKLERPMAPAMPCNRASNSITKVAAKPEIVSDPKRIPKQCMDVWWNLMNPQGNRRDLLSPEIMKTTLQEKGLLRRRITTWHTRSPPMATSDANSRCKSRSGQGME